MSQKQKRNHWVPQGYLRSFATDASRKRVWTLGKAGGDPEMKPIKSVAVRFYLYAPKGNNGRDYRFEGKLASLESWFGSPYWRALTTDFLDLGDMTLRKMVALLVAVMWMRTPLQLAWMKDLHRQITTAIEQEPDNPIGIEVAGKTFPFDEVAWKVYRDASDDDIKRMWIAQVGSATSLATMLLEMRWAILVADQPSFITTDNPVVFLHPDLRFRGAKNPETSIIFPLSPTRLLHLDNRRSEPDNQYYPLKVGPGAWNGLLWREALNLMISPRHTDEVCAEMCQNAEAMGFVWRPGGWVKRDSEASVL